MLVYCRGVVECRLVSQILLEGTIIRLQKVYHNKLYSFETKVMETSLCVIRHVQGASHHKALFLMMYLVCTVLVKWFKYTFKRGLCLEDLLLNSLQKFILKNLKPLVQSRISTICHGPSFIHPGPTILLPA